MDRLPLASRSLLLPGPQPPLSHLGVTLLRHAVGSGLRYGLYQLGLPMPEAAPVRIFRLRLYLEAAAVVRVIADEPGGREVAAALVDPGGGAHGGLPVRVRAAVAFHRARLRLPPRQRPRVRADRGASPWQTFRDALTAWLPLTNDAMLAELVAALDRRRQRRRGRILPPVMSPQAARHLSGRRARRECLGHPDLLRPSWAERSLRRTVPPADLPRATHPGRGRFRETYRAALDGLRPLYLRLAASAVTRGLLDEAEEAFFLPLDVAADLELDRRPAWLQPAVAANRREYEAQLAAAPVPEVLAIGEQASVAVALGSRPDWELAAVAPLA